MAGDADVEAKVYDGDGKVGGKYTAVYVAARNNKLRVLRFLLCAAGADPNADCGSYSKASSGRDTPCYIACWFHRHDAVRMLVARGARPDHSTGTGRQRKCPARLPRRSTGLHVTRTKRGGERWSAQLLCRKPLPNRLQTTP